MKDILYSTNCQKILSFLLSNPDKEFYDLEISKLTGVSRAGANFALKDLEKSNLVKRERKGRMCFYRIDIKDKLIQYLKIVQNIILLYPLVCELKAISVKIILYGSSAKGENLSDSDIDLFVISRHPRKAKEIIFKDPLREKIQYVINTPNEFAMLKKENSVFYKEISHGMILWEEK